MIMLNNYICCNTKKIFVPIDKHSLGLHKYYNYSKIETEFYFVENVNLYKKKKKQTINRKCKINLKNYIIPRQREFSKLD